MWHGCVAFSFPDQVPKAVGFCLSMFCLGVLLLLLFFPTKGQTDKGFRAKT